MRRRRRCRRSGVTAALASLAIAGGTLATGTLAHEGGAASGGSGGSIAAVQQALGVPADGIYGPQTRSAVMSFQRANGLAVDGIVGQQTLAALGLGGAAAGAGDPAAGASAPSGSPLASIAQCESGGDPTAVSADGRYYGKYQFSPETWASVGGSGNPANASEAEQDRRAAILYERAGSTPWPNCG